MGCGCLYVRFGGCECACQELGNVFDLVVSYEQLECSFVYYVIGCVSKLLKLCAVRVGEWFLFEHGELCEGVLVVLGYG